MTTNQYNLALLGFGFVQALLVMIILFIKGRSNRGSSIYLVLLIFTITLLLLIKILSKEWLMTHARDFYLTGYFLPYLVGPLLFLYVRQTLHPARVWQWRDGYHFIPYLFFALEQFMYSQTGRSVFEAIPSALRTLLYAMAAWQFLSLFIYGRKSLMLLTKHTQTAVHVYSDQRETELTWLRELIWAVTISMVLVTLTLHLMYRLHPGYTGLRWVFLILTGLIYWITFKVITNPIFITLAPQPEVEVLLKAKYTGSGLKKEQADQILARLSDLMKRDKPFLDPAITIETLSGKLAVSRHHISQVLNEIAGKNFYDFVNEYRIGEAKRLLHDPGKKHLSIAGIGSESGFNSVSSFNLVFKKHAGITPSQFKKSYTAQPMGSVTGITS